MDVSSGFPSFPHCLRHEMLGTSYNENVEKREKTLSTASVSPGFVQYSHCSNISDQMKNDFKKVLKNFPKGIWASEFPYKYKVTLGLDLNFQSLGYCNFLDLVFALPDIFVRKKLQGCKNDWLLHDVETYDEIVPISEPKMPLLNLTDKFHNIVTNIRSILQSNPEGITTEDFYELYKMNFEEILKPQEFGFNCLNTFLTSIKDTVPLKMMNRKNKLVVYFDALKSVAHSDPVFCAPEDVVDTITSYRKQPWPSDSIFDSFVELYLTSAGEPSNIWINLKGEKTSNSLEKLQVDLLNFYNDENSDYYSMHNNHIVNGCVCAGKWHDDKWYRLRITKVLNYGSVMAYFVDFGILDLLPKAYLRYLKKAFFELPGQAIKIRLSDIKPKNHIWDKKAGLRLEQFKGKSLIGYVNAFSLHDCVLHLYLFHMYAANNIVILNDLMVREDFATSCDDAFEIKNLVCNPKPFSAVYKVSQVDVLHNYEQLPHEYENLHSFSRFLNVQSHQPAFCVQKDQKIEKQFKSTAICTVPSFETLSEEYSSASELSPCSSRNSVSSVNGSCVPKNFEQLLHQDTTNLHSTAIEQLAVFPAKSIKANDNHCYVSRFARSKLSSPSSLFHHSLETEVNGYIKPPVSPYTDINKGQSKPFSENRSDLQVTVRKPLLNRSVFRVDKNICGYYPHLITLVDRLHISSSDISTLLWRRDDSNLVYEKLKNHRTVAAYPITLYATNNEVLFKDILKHNVRGVQRVRYKGTDTVKLVVYPLAVSIPIFELFGDSHLVNEMKSLLQEYDAIACRMFHESLSDIGTMNKDKS